MGGPSVRVWVLSWEGGLSPLCKEGAPMVGGYCPHNFTQDQCALEARTDLSGSMVTGNRPVLPIAELSEDPCELGTLSVCKWGRYWPPGERLGIQLRSTKIVCYLCHFFIVFCYKNGCMWVGVQSGKFLKVKPVPGPSLFKMEVIPERLTLEKAREAREDHVKRWASVC